MMLVYRSNRTEVLVEALGDVLAVPVGPPLEPESVVVQSRGMERWLSMQLARRIGVWTNARFPFPRNFVETAFLAALPDLRESSHGPDDAGGASASVADPYAPEALVWSVLAVLPAFLERPSFAPLARFLADDPRGLKRYQLARRIADTFDQYVVYRPEMILGWEAGAGDEDGWQAELWRAVVALAEARRGDAGRSKGPRHTAALAQRFFATLPRCDEATLTEGGLPRRVTVFGVSALPPLYLRVLEAVGQRRPVHLFLLSPSRQFWGDIRPAREIARRSAAAGEGADALHLMEGHPLLASLGQLGRDFVQLLEEGGAYTEPSADLHRDPGDATALAVLQSDILELRHRRPGAGGVLPARLPIDDRSIAIHACHGPLREVEVLRDQLLGLFDDDPALCPEDVVVMTPDIEAYAPYVEAVFGGGAGGTGDATIPFRIADRPVRRDDAVIEAFLAILGRGRGRLAASEVLDLLALAPVRDAFGILADDLDTLRRWVAESGVRWGVDGAHRAAHGQPAFEENTWRFGLDRMLLGYALPGEGRRLFGGVLPYDEIEGQAGALLGRFAAFCDTLFERLAALDAPRTVASWEGELSGTLDVLLSRADPWGASHKAVRDALHDLTRWSEQAGFLEEVDLDVVRGILTTRFDAGHPTVGFLSGGVTFCAMLPMRSVPFRVVYLLGLDDGRFPRSIRPVGFDLVARHPRPGDRSRRADDRYLFLEALLQARDRLILSYVGRDIRDDAELPPSVVVSELLDALVEGFRPEDEPTWGQARGRTQEDGAPLGAAEVPVGDEPNDTPDGATVASRRTRFVVRHPMQSFSPRYFGADPDRRLFSYGRGGRDGAAVLCGERHEAPPFLRAPLPPLAAGDVASVSLDVLARFLRHPVAFFLRERLGLALDGSVAPVDDREPLELDGLQRYAVATALLERSLEGERLGDCRPSVRAAGALPLGVPGDLVFDDIAATVAPVADAVRSVWRGAPLEPLEVDLDLDGVRLVGWLDGVRRDALVRARYARVSPAHQLDLWVRHLALCAVGEISAGGTAVGAPGYPRKSVLVGRDPDGAPAIQLAFRKVADARARLAHLVALWRAGLAEPLCLFQTASYAWAVERAARGDAPDGEERAAQAARKAWFSSEWASAEDADPAHRLVFADRDPLDPTFRLFADHLPAGGGFRGLATAVWAPLLAHREVIRND